MSFLFSKPTNVDAPAGLPDEQHCEKIFGEASKRKTTNESKNVLLFDIYVNAVF